MQINWNELRQYRESNRVEAKKAVGGLPHSIWETYSSFANTAGEFASLLGVTGARVRVLMSQLTAAGVVVVDGANCNRTYRLK